MQGLWNQKTEEEEELEGTAGESLLRHFPGDGGLFFHQDLELSGRHEDESGPG